MRRWLTACGGGYHAELTKARIIRAALATTEADLLNLVTFGRGHAFSPDEISRLDLPTFRRRAKSRRPLS